MQRPIAWVYRSKSAMVVLNNEVCWKSDGDRYEFAEGIGSELGRYARNLHRAAM